MPRASSSSRATRPSTEVGHASGSGAKIERRCVDAVRGHRINSVEGAVHHRGRTGVPGPARPVAEARSGETLGDKNSCGCCHRLNGSAARGVLASRPPGLWPDDRLHDLQVDSHHPGRRRDRCLRDLRADRHSPGSRPDSRCPSHPNDDRSSGFPLGPDRANWYRRNSRHARHRLRRLRRRSRHRLDNHRLHRPDNRCSHMPDWRSRARTRPHTYRKRSPEAVPPQGSRGPPSVCVDDTFRSLPPPSAVDRQPLVEQDQSVQFVVADCAETAAISWHFAGNFAVTVVAP
jgi:hypothetical protein